MKYLLNLILLPFLFVCCGPNGNPVNNSTTNANPSPYLPLKLGNQWIYDWSSYTVFEGNVPTDTGTAILKVVSFDTVLYTPPEYVYTLTLERKNLKGISKKTDTLYITNNNGKISHWDTLGGYYYWRIWNDNMKDTSYCSFLQGEHYHNNTVSFGIKTVNDTSITVSAGTYNKCLGLITEEYISTALMENITINEFYSKNIGLVYCDYKHQTSWPSEVYEQFRLSSYILK